MVPLWTSADGSVSAERFTISVEIDALVNVFTRVASEKGWQPGGALSLYRERSVYFGLMVSGQLAGGLQLVLPDSSKGLSCQAIWPEVAIGPQNRCAHVAIMALDREYRGSSMLFWHLAAEMWRYCVGNGISTLFIEVSPRVLPLYRRLGWPLKILGDARIHWGSDTLLCSLEVPEVAATLLRRAENSGYYKQIIAQAFRLNVAVKQIGVAIYDTDETQVVCAG